MDFSTKIDILYYVSYKSDRLRKKLNKTAALHCNQLIALGNQIKRLQNEVKRDKKTLNSWKYLSFFTLLFKRKQFEAQKNKVKNKERDILKLKQELEKLKAKSTTTIYQIEEEIEKLDNIFSDFVKKL